MRVIDRTGVAEASAFDQAEADQMIEFSEDPHLDALKQTIAYNRAQAERKAARQVPQFIAPQLLEWIALIEFFVIGAGVIWTIARMAQKAGLPW